ncbi:MAG: restriction endonuclease subunit S [Campylobacter sp.]|nr:restriction endonuclease subunit S [Campylobacter sp.]
MQKPSKLAQIPQIRFAGFTKPWEIRKLGDCAKFSKGSGYSKNDLCNIGTPIILYGRLYTKYETIIKKVNTFVRPKDSSVYSKGGEIIIPASGETANDIARASAVENSGILLGGDLNIISPDKAINSAFLALSISNGKPQKELAKKAQGKSVVHISNSEIKELNIPFPQKAEQQKIGELFANLDNLITIHQRKVEKLQKIKKSCLQNLFPQNNQNTPKIRFKNFTDEWVEKKFGEIFKYERPDRFIVKNDEYDEKANTPVLTANKAFILGYTNENNTYNNESIIFDDFTLDCKYVDFPYMVKSSAIKILTIKNKEENNLKFAFENLNSTKFEVMGHARHYIAFIQNTATFVPNLAEQCKISEFFAKLDKLIALHQSKFKKLQKIKKSCLQNMFV